jgi:Niemann-Pick C1 protein
MVKEIEYFMDPTFAEKLYDSCKNVYSPTFGAPAITAMCSSWGHELCNFRRFFDFLGDVVNNAYVPFQITYNFDETPTGIIPYTSKVTPCNEAADVSAIVVFIY